MEILQKTILKSFELRVFVFRQHQWCQGVFDPELKTPPRIGPELKTHPSTELKTHPRMELNFNLKTHPRTERVSKTTSVEPPLPAVSNFEF